MKLYYARGACSLASHIVGLEGGLNLSLDQVDIKAHRTETGADYCAINPKGYVPALELDDGSLLTENIAVLSFLGDAAKLMPANGMPRYRVLEWIAYISGELHKNFTPLFHSSADKEKSEAREQIIRRLRFIEDRLSGDWLMGDRFTVADAYLFVILRWAKTFHLDLSSMPKLVAFKTRMEQRPAVKQALAAEGL